MLGGGFLLALRLLEHPCPVVVACNGHAVAMGTFLVLSADYRVGVNGPYRLVANEVAIGLTMPRAAIEICRRRLAPAHLNRAVILAESYGPSNAVGGVPRPGRRRARLAMAAASVAGQYLGLDRRTHAAPDTDYPGSTPSVAPSPDRAPEVAGPSGEASTATRGRGSSGWSSAAVTMASSDRCLDHLGHEVEATHPSPRDDEAVGAGHPG